MPDKVSELGEHALIERIRSRVPFRPENVIVGIGDDAAVIDNERGQVPVVTTDALVEGTHFARRFNSASDIGYKALAVNLSDLAAMGARPQHALLSLILPPVTTTQDVDDIVDAFLELASTYSVALIGGNVSATVSSQPNVLVVDVTVIGGGPGGYVCAIRLSQLGLKTACIEYRGTLGGTCLNIGCIPSKSLLHLSENFHKAKNFEKLGIETGEIKLNLEKMMKNKDKAVTVLTKGVEFLFKKNKVTYFKGTGSFKNKNQISIINNKEETAIETKNIIISTGSEPVSLRGIEFDEEKILSSTGALSISKLPKKMVVVGGGYIGLEMGSVWSRLGTEVQVIEFLDHITPGMDKEISTEFMKILKKQGIKFELKTKVEKITKSKNGVIIETFSKEGKKNKFEADVVLISVGRKPYTKNLNLEKIGVELDKRGSVKVNKNFQTNIKNIYAIGDVIEGPMLAHKAEEEGIAVAELISGQSGHVNYDTIPGVIYTSPEVASIGKTEEQLKEKGISYKIGKFPFLANSRAKTIDESEGFVKILADSTTDKVLGVHIIGQHAGEMIAEMSVAMEFGASSEDIARTCHAHPTFSEAIKEAALSVEKRQIHS